MTELDDTALVEQCRAGDKATFATLVTRYQARVRRVLLAVLPYPGEVEDVLQETFLQAYLGLAQLRDPARFRAWVCGIGLNLARLRLRSSPRFSLSWEELDRVGAMVPDKRPSPERLAEVYETAHRLRQAIADLPPAERDALLLVYYDGLSHRETAEQLGTSLSAVKVRVHRGRRRLQAALQTEFGAVSRFSPGQVEVEMIKVTIHDVLANVTEIDTQSLLAPVLDLLPAENREEFLKGATFELTNSVHLWEQMERLPEEQRQAVRQGLSRFTAHRVVLLKEEAGNRVLPLWIGPFEAAAIVLKLTGVVFKRPISFDLMKTLLEVGGLRIEQAAVSRLHEHIYYGMLIVRRDGESAPVEVDCRPSDALSLAVRMDIPLFVAADVMAETGILPDEDGRYDFDKESSGIAWQSLLSPSSASI